MLVSRGGSTIFPRAARRVKHNVRTLSKQHARSHSHVIGDRHPVRAFTSLFFGEVSDARWRIISLIMRHQIARLGSSKRDDWQLSNYSPLPPPDSRLPRSRFDVPENGSSKFVTSAAPSRFGHFVRPGYLSFACLELHL